MSTLPLFERPTLLDVKPPELRPYQARGIEVLRARVREGKKRIVLVAPTGAGKAVLMAAIIRTSTVPVLVVVHRMELIDQQAAQLAKLGITNIGVMRGDDERTDPNASVQLASIQTLARREKPPAGLVLIDECHRAAADSYIDNVFGAYPDAIILGFTATPTRQDGKPLGNLFESLEVISTYIDLIRQGFIVAPECYTTPKKLDLSGVRTIGGDYNEGELGAVMRNDKLVGDLLEHWLALSDKYPNPKGGIGLVVGPRRRTFIFASGIEHSLQICERFSAAGVRIAHVDGNTPEDDRRRIVASLGNGTLDAISNCNVLLEGVDVPSAKCVVHARPTQSLVLYRQSVGRILRPWENTPPLLLDHAGNIDRHGFPHEDLHWELNAKPRQIEKKPQMKICKGCYAYVAIGRSLCPHCGYEFKPEDAPKQTIAETKEQLVRRSTTPEDMQRAFFDGMVQLARRRGHKPGFASAKFKEHYGSWPPWAWSDAIKASFASDPEWQANYEAKVSRKEAAERMEAALDVGLDDAVEYPEGETGAEPTEPTEEDLFGDFLRDQGIQ